MDLKLRKIVLFLLWQLMSTPFIFGQEPPVNPDSLRILQDTIRIDTITGTASEPSLGQDSITIFRDTIPNDPIPREYRDSAFIIEPYQTGQDTIPVDTIPEAGEESSPDAIDYPIDYQAEDSLSMEIEEEKVYLYGKGVVKYQDIVLAADYIELDMANDEVYARGVIDSLGKVIGRPVFKEGSESFESKTIRYNFKTGRGIIEDVVSEQEGGFLHSGLTKKYEDGEIHVQAGKYTTCDAGDPHYYVGLSKAKVIPDDKIVSGPAYLVVADIPLPIVIPFGFFPNQKTRASGILIPSYGEERRRGFFFRNGGYYIALGDYVDLNMTGDIYTNGTWGVTLGSNYRLMYRFNGNLRARYYKNISGEKDFENYTITKDYAISWTHSQDPKANPGRTFSANVNMSSSTFDRNHSFNASDYLTNTKQSSISYSKRWIGSPFNFSTSLNHRQNSNTRSIDLNLPKMNFNMSRVYPFKRKNAVGSARWYESIELSYKAKLDNQIRTNDTTLFTSAVFDDMNNGFQHDIPISTQFRPFNNFSVSPSIRYTGVLYTKQIVKRWEENYYDPETDEYGKLVTDTIDGLKYGHAYLPAISMSFNPKLFGMFQVKNPDSRLEAVRHVMTPSVSFSFIPDMSSVTPDYYRKVQKDTLGNMEQYSIFQGSLYGTPSIPGKSGSISFRLNNNIEAKVKSYKDTAVTVKKVKILDNLGFSTSYNLFADSMKLAPISMAGRTNFLNKINVSFGGTFDPYALSEDNTRIDKFEFNETGKLARLIRFNLSVDFRLNSKKGTSTIPTGGQSRPGGMPGDLPGDEGIITAEEEEEAMLSEFYTGDYVDFSIPWNISVRYNYNYSKPTITKIITQTFNFSGNVSLTPKWKIGLSSGYDFKDKKLTYTSVNFYRDLHCWEMRLSWIPLGYHQSYSFQINVKSAILKDLKYEKRKSWYDKD